MVVASGVNFGFLTLLNFQLGGNKGTSDVSNVSSSPKCMSVNKYFHFYLLTYSFR